MRIAVLSSSDVAWALGIASSWAAGGDDVTVVLLDAATAAARRGHDGAEAVEGALAAGVAVQAHDEALLRRAIDVGRLVEGVKVTTLDEVADLVVEGSDRVMWL